MKRSIVWFLIVSVVFSSNCSAELLIYRYAGKETYIRSGEDLTYGYQGQMMIDSSKLNDSGSTNLMFVGWATVNHHKSYWIHPETNYYVIQFSGTGTKTYTVLGRAAHGVDTNGYVELTSHIFEGENRPLKTGTNSSVSFPKVFQGDDKNIGFNSQVNAMAWTQTTVSYVFSAASTQSANNKGQSLDEVANALSQVLESRGYQKE